MKRTSNYLKALHITSPTVIIDKKRVISNISRMVQKANAAGVTLRPHFKTHQSAEIGNWFKNVGISKITASSVDMAQYFSDHGWNDITIAILVNILEMNKINELAGKIKLNLLVDSEVAIQELNNVLTNPVSAWIKIDAGYKRTGIYWDDMKTIFSLIRLIHNSAMLTFSGILTHSGQTYSTSSVSEIHEIHKITTTRLLKIKTQIEHEFPRIRCYISIGDTPSCSVVPQFQGIDEIRPGNFVFYDLVQERLGVCTENEIAVAVACPIIGKYDNRGQIVIQGGAVHFSKAYLFDENNRKIFGYLTTVSKDGFGPIIHTAAVTSLTQEHGIIEVDDNILNQVDIGDLVLIYPVHSCLTCDLHETYTTIEGEIIDRL